MNSNANSSNNKKEGGSKRIMFESQPFSGQGDSRVVSFRIAMNNKIFEAGFFEFTKNFVLPDTTTVDAYLKTMGEREVRSFMYMETEQGQ